MMAEELSGVTVVIFIACGILTFILLFIFAKRQIMRFALRSRRGPHIPIGHGAKTSLKREIDHHIEVIPRIVYEPALLDDNSSDVTVHNLQNQPSHYCRLKTVNDVKLLEKEIAKKDPSLQRYATDNLRSFLLMALVAPMNGSSQKLIHQFCDLYEHARHDPSEFGEEEYQLYSKLLLKLIDVAKLIRSYPNSRKTSPSKTPIKKSQPSEYQLQKDKSIDDILRSAEKESRPCTLIIPLEDSETSV